MKISKIHQKFSYYLPKALKSPEDYLGPNWEDVINFWLYLDTLNQGEINKIDNLYCDLEYNTRNSAKNVAMNAAYDVVGEEVKYAVWQSVYYITFCDVFRRATYELIAQHKLLEQGKTLVFLPLCLKS
jgi:hypothetical protein